MTEPIKCDDCGEETEPEFTFVFSHGAYCPDCYFEKITTGEMEPDGELIGDDE